MGLLHSLRGRSRKSFRMRLWMRTRLGDILRFIGFRANALDVESHAD